MHHLAKRCDALSDDDVEVIGHDRERDQRHSRRSRCIHDFRSYEFAQRLGEPRTVSLRARRYVKNAAGRVDS